MNGWMHGWMYRWMHGWMDEWIDAMNGWMLWVWRGGWMVEAPWIGDII